MASYKEQLSQALTDKFIKDGMDAAIAPTAAGLVADRVRLDHAGKVITPVADTIAAIRGEHPALWSTIAKPVGGMTPDTRSAMQRDVDAARAKAEASRKARIDELRAHGNPWNASTINLTRQSVLMNLAPDLAERLKAEAGARV